MKFLDGFLTGVILCNRNVILRKIVIGVSSIVTLINKNNNKNNKINNKIFKINIVQVENNHLINKETKNIVLDYHHIDLKYLVTKNISDNSLIFVYYYLENKEYIDCYKNNEVPLVFSDITPNENNDKNIICCTLKYNDKVLYLTKYLSKFNLESISKNKITFQDILYNLDNFDEEMLTGMITVFQNNKFIELPINSELPTN